MLCAKQLYFTCENDLIKIVLVNGGSKPVDHGSHLNEIKMICQDENYDKAIITK